jgi:hypothetical protein
MYAKLQQMPEIIQKFWNPVVSLKHVQEVVRPAVQSCPAVQAVRSETGCRPESENAEWQIDCPRFYELLQYRKEDIAEWAAAEKKCPKKSRQRTISWSRYRQRAEKHAASTIISPWIAYAPP